MAKRSLTLREYGLTLTRFFQILHIMFTEWLRWLVQRKAVAEHLYCAIVRLGPTFIKLGQVASTRPDLVPTEISERLKQLQENVPPFSFAAARVVIEGELKKPLNECFAYFPQEPTASASLSQVYFATLPDGIPVAVKVQRPGIRRLMERDLAILRGIAWLAERLNRGLRDLRLTNIVQEFGRWTLKELDFEIEGHNAEVFRQNFAGWDDVIFPQIYWSHTKPRLLTMQRLSGIRVGDVPNRFGTSVAHQLAQRLAEIQMKMFITDGFFHADLHPGNIFFQPDGRIAVLDLGMVGQLTPQQRDRFLAYWIAITRHQRDRAFHHLTRMAETTDGADLDGFRTSYEVSLDRFYASTLSERSLAQTYLEIIVNGARYGIVFPPEMVLQAKAIVTAEALDLVLAPDFRFADEVRPFVARELAQRAAPHRLLDRLWSGAAEWVLLGEAVPTETFSSDGIPEEVAFRHQAQTALIAFWLDTLDDCLSKIQADLPRYTSAAYWTEHIDRQMLLDTTFGLLRVLSTLFSHIEQESHVENSPERAVNGNHAQTDGAQDRWQTSSRENRNQSALGDELAETFGHLRNLVAGYTDSTFWDEHSLDKAAMMSTLAMLRHWLSQFGQVLRVNND